MAKEGELLRLRNLMQATWFRSEAETLLTLCTDHHNISKWCIKVTKSIINNSITHQINNSTIQQFNKSLNRQI